jgi:hypothetical protein
MARAKAGQGDGSEGAPRDTPRSVATQPPLLSSLYAEIVDRVLGELDGARAVSGPDTRPWIERLAREAVDLMAEAYGVGAVAHMTAHSDLFRQYIGAGVLALTGNMSRAFAVAPKPDIGVQTSSAPTPSGLA